MCGALLRVAWLVLTVRCFTVRCVVVRGPTLVCRVSFRVRAGPFALLCSVAFFVALLSFALFCFVLLCVVRR